MLRLLLVAGLGGLTAGLWYLSAADRMTPLALRVVELEGQVGVPLWMPGLVVTTAAALLAWLEARPARPSPPRATPRSVPSRVEAPAAAPREGEWYAAARAAAHALPLAPSGEVRFDEAVGLPFTLRLRGATVEQARRRLELYVAFLASVPTPPKGRVYLESSPDVQVAPIHLVNAAMKRHFAAEDYQVVNHGSGVDVLFVRPDPRWSAR